MLRRWLDRPTGGASFLQDLERSVWAEDQTDFMSIFPGNVENDFFSSALRGVLLDLYHRLWGKRKVGRTVSTTEAVSHAYGIVETGSGRVSPLLRGRDCTN